MKRIMTMAMLVIATACAAPRAGTALPEPIAAWREYAGKEEPPLPEGTRVLRDVAYGDHPRQRMDVYLPARPDNAATGSHSSGASRDHGFSAILLVHGGGWARGYKDHPGLVPDKASYWLPRGYVLVSINYRLLPDAAPLEQARDVARALAAAQRLAPQWNADPARFVLMGHSAGAHLATLVGSHASLWRAQGALRPRGVVSLDSGTLDVVETMQTPRRPVLFDRAFGTQQDDWVAASPYHQLSQDAVPMLIVCMTRRPDACPQGRAMAAKATRLGVRVEVLPQDLTHMQVNRVLGQASAYTEAVDAFLRSVLR